MTKQHDLSEAEKELLLHSLSAVGPHKPIGYLPLYTLEDYVQVDPNDVMQRASARGLASACFGPNECCIKSGALYVYDADALATLLGVHVSLLAAEEMSSDPHAFVAQIAAVWLEPSHPIYPILAEAFGGSS